MSVEPISIKLFLARGSSTGLRTAEISNWSGKAIACSRKELDELSKRDEAVRPGVYLLLGVDLDSNEPAVYIGEAEEVGRRLKQHFSKEFWNQVIVFVSKDENLTKSHIKYLEGRLINIGLDAGKGLVMNNQASGAKLPESDQAEMDVYLDRMLRLLPVLGTSLFARPAENNSTIHEKLMLTTKGIYAYGNRTENGFIVYKGSQAVPDERKSAVRSKKWRKELIEKGVLLAHGDHLIFSKDHEFNSPSQAGTIICGGATNGLTQWKTKQGKSLKELEAEL